ncbi:PLP-dependent aminotransferase family protein [Pelagibaculum spongiae]|uniref:PLP-dependent aminotransferase family protein n=1 Tax=Pelagibaculum spongiae TaxID=2080658 RepID=A0A2V1GXZ9_9GAMM|nr:PLP-dependent aminotransferase family protein [Pelagibaculum spongiae]PVZ65434.1 PLP-dependent aminotransferase family protein [Pelagibaculum spongiae]
MKQSLLEMHVLGLDKRADMPLHQQLYQGLRQKILNGYLTNAMRLPSSRVLAKELAISRNTVISAYQQLQAEGYLESRVGAGFFVARQLPENWIEARRLADSITVADSKPVSVNRKLPDNNAVKYGRTIPVVTNSGADGSAGTGFAVGVPDLANFPHKIWNRLSQQIPSKSLISLMGYSDPQGLPELRAAIAEYLKSARSVICNPEQILITNGAQQALDLTSRLLIQPEDNAIIEEPGYLGARHALLSAGAQLKTCSVDQQGIKVNQLTALTDAKTRLLYCTPTHQYPTGAVMPLERRMALLEWANQHDCWVVEDDYDSEYHYRSRPLASLQGIDHHQRVIYMGSFSKVLFPSLRLGYLVLPQDLMPVFVAAKNVHSGETPLHNQKITAEFIQQGHFARHLRKSRQSYAAKLQHMQACCESLKQWFDVSDSGSGMHVVLQLKPGFSNLEFEADLSSSLLKAQVFHSRLSRYYFGSVKEYGLVLGFANSPQEEIKNKVAVLEHSIKLLANT